MLVESKRTQDTTEKKAEEKEKKTDTNNDDDDGSIANAHCNVCGVRKWAPFHHTFPFLIDQVTDEMEISCLFISCLHSIVSWARC